MKVRLTVSIDYTADPWDYDSTEDDFTLATVEEMDGMDLMETLGNLLQGYEAVVQFEEVKS
jgi:hypothetical protein